MGVTFRCELVHCLISTCFEHVRAGGWGCSNQAVYTFIMGHVGGDLYRLIPMAQSR